MTRQARQPWQLLTCCLRCYVSFPGLNTDLWSSDPGLDVEAEHRRGPLWKFNCAPLGKLPWATIKAYNKHAYSGSCTKSTNSRYTRWLCLDGMAMSPNSNTLNVCQVFLDAQTTFSSVRINNFLIGGGGGILPIFSIYMYICAARMPLFLTIFLSMATSKMAIYSQ